MSKCNFCMDDLDAGLPPACVAACPMRVLDFVTVDDGPQTVENSPPSTVHGLAELWESPATEHPFPLPTYSRTQPHLAIKSHAGMLNSLEKAISNCEETRPVKTKSELPLVAFTLLGQAAAGMAVLAFFSGPLTIPLLVVVGTLLGLGGLAAFFHLGTPKNAWRAGFHVRKSWLSREILMIGLFGGSWFVSFFAPGMGKLPLALTGLGLVLSMAQVYRLHSMRAWDTNRTFLAFIVSALLLGGLGLEILNMASSGIPKPEYQFAFGAGWVGALWLSLTDRNPAGKTAGRLRLGLIGLALAGVASMYLWPASVGRWSMLPIILITFAEEAIGRWRFYEYIHQRPM